MKDRKPEDMRREFWSATNDTRVDRPTVAAVLFQSVASLELYALKGTGPKYMGRGRGRPVLYRKGDVVEWIENSGRLVTATAELATEAAR